MDEQIMRTQSAERDRFRPLEFALALVKLAAKSTLFSGVILLGVVSAAQAQITEKDILDLLAQSDLATARQKVDEVSRRFPDSPIAIYFQALLEERGELAIDLYRALVKKYPSSDYAPRALYRIAQYDFARGYYYTARSTFLEIKRKIPSTTLADLAEYYAAKCLFAAGKPDSSRMELEQLVARSRSQVLIALAREDLAGLRNDKGGHASSGDRKIAPQIGRFTLQVGAYSNRENAESQQRYFNLLGYPAEVSETSLNGITLFRVYVGRFASQEKAKAVGDSFKASQHIEYKIVELK